jgi:hypothetical protein
MKSRMIEHLTKYAEFHTGCAKAHDAAAKESSGASKKFHEASRDLHSDAGEHCVQMCKTLVASNSDSIDDVTPSTSVRGGNDAGGPKAMESFGMRKALAEEKEPVAFGMAAARERLDKVAATRVSAVAPEAPGLRLVTRTGAPSFPSTGDPTDALDAALRK